MMQQSSPVCGEFRLEGCIRIKIAWIFGWRLCKRNAIGTVLEGKASFRDMFMRLQDVCTAAPCILASWLFRGIWKHYTPGLTKVMQERALRCVSGPIKRQAGETITELIERNGERSDRECDEGGERKPAQSKVKNSQDYAYAFDAHNIRICGAVDLELLVGR
jgi:hypothetical protein